MRQGAGVADDAALDDAWVDELEAQPESRSARVVMAETFTGPLRWVRRVIDFLTTTPGRIVIIMVVLTAALLAAGVSMSQSLAQRQDSMDVLVNSTEPMSNSAHVLVTSLSQADTVATTTFVKPGYANQDEMDRFARSIDSAVVASNQVLQGAVAAGPRDNEIRDLATQIQRDIPAYTALMERARTNQRMGNPVSVAYMSTASAMMRERILGDATRLFDLTRGQVADEMARLSEPQWVPLSGLIAALVFLAAAQLWLWRVFRRRFNSGFLAATAMMAVALVWAAAANFSVWRSGQIEFERAATPWEQLTSARIDAQETRTDEIFSLLRRQSAAEASAGAGFDATSGSVAAALDAAESSTAVTTDPRAIASAREALGEWGDAHDELVRALGAGQFDQAVELLTTSGEPSGGEATSTERSYDRLDENLVTLVGQAREDMRVFIAASLDATRAVAGAVLLLSLLSVLTIWLGIRRRLGEYL